MGVLKHSQTHYLQFIAVAAGPDPNNIKLWGLAVFLGLGYIKTLKHQMAIMFVLPQKAAEQKVAISVGLCD